MLLIYSIGIIITNNFSIFTQETIRQVQSCVFFPNGIFAKKGSSLLKNARLKFRNKPYTNSLYNIKENTLKTLKTIFLILILFIFGCKSDKKLSGNYSTCHKGLYAELYIENDSMQSATSLDWVSNWVKFELKNDTIYHLYFGEIADSAKAKINYVRKDGFELYYPKDSVTYTFKRMNIQIDGKETYDEFWNGFYKRRIEFDCFTYSDKYSELKNYFGSENIQIDYSGESFNEVRITHIPTGKIEFGNKYDTQIENAILALEKLKSKLEE